MAKYLSPSLVLVTAVLLVACASEADRQREAAAKQQRNLWAAKLHPAFLQLRAGMSADDVTKLDLRTFCTASDRQCNDAFACEGNCALSFVNGQLKSFNWYGPR